MNKEEQALAKALLNYFATIDTAETVLDIVLREETLRFRISMDFAVSATREVKQSIEPAETKVAELGGGGVTQSPLSKVFGWADLS